MDEFIEEIKGKSDEELEGMLKLTQGNQSTQYKYIKAMVESFKSGELKLKYADRLRQSDLMSLYESLGPEFDDYKMNSWGSEDILMDIARIVRTIVNDEVKIQAIKRIVNSHEAKNDVVIIDLIDSLKKDESKLKVMKENRELSERKENGDEDAILYFEDSEMDYYKIAKKMGESKRIEALQFFTTNLHTRNLLKGIEVDTDEMRAAIINFSNCDEIIHKYIMEFSDDTKRLEFLHNLGSDYYKAKVIVSLSNDDVKLQELKKIKSEGAKLDIICSLKNDDIKMEEVDKITLLKNGQAIVEVIRTLESDERKIKEMDERLHDEMAKADIIISLEDDNLKMEQLKQVKDEFAIARIIQTIQSLDKKIKAMEGIHSERAKAKVVQSLPNDSLKIELLQNFESEFAKASIIKTISDDKTKLELAQELKSDLPKVIVLEQMNDKDEAIKLINGIKDELAKGLSAELCSALEKLSDIGCSRTLQQKENVKELLLDGNRKYSRFGLSDETTIGIEIECEGELFEVLTWLQGIPSGLYEGSWFPKNDGSLEDGTEVVSPILKDSSDGVEDLYMVCNLLKRCNMQTSQRCGGHIHIGSDCLKSKEAYANLYEIFGNTERIISLMCNEEWTIPRESVTEVAEPVSPKVENAIQRGTVDLNETDDIDQFIVKMQLVQKHRDSSLNIRNINESKNTIEFRMPNGTLNAETWVENVRLFGRMVEMAQQLAEIEKKSIKTDREKELLDIKEWLKEDIDEEEKMELLLNMLFNEDEREVYRNRYIANSKVINNIEENDNPLRGAQYGKVDFSRIKRLAQGRDRE